MGKHVKTIGGNYSVNTQVSKSDIDGNLGQCVFASREIFVAADQDEDEKWRTLIHEIIEAGNRDMNIGLPHRAIEKLERVIYCMFKLAGISVESLIQEDE